MSPVSPSKASAPQISFSLEVFLSPYLLLPQKRGPRILRLLVERKQKWQANEKVSKTQIIQKQKSCQWQDMAVCRRLFSEGNSTLCDTIDVYICYFAHVFIWFYIVMLFFCVHFPIFLLEMQSWRANLPSCEFLRRESSLTKSPDDMVLCSFFFSSELAGWNNIGTGNILRQNGKMRRRKKEIPFLQVWLWAEGKNEPLDGSTTSLVLHWLKLHFAKHDVKKV